MRFLRPFRDIYTGLWAAWYLLRPRKPSPASPRPVPAAPPVRPVMAPPLPRRRQRHLDGSHEACPLSDSEEMRWEYFTRRYPSLGAHVSSREDRP